MFYFFKASANRCEKLKEAQQLLDEDEMKVKEVHEVRWMSIYKAVDTVFRSLDSLITLFTTDKDAKGYAKKLATYDFIATTYMLKDILPIITALCLVFQRRDLDVTEVQTNIDHCIRSLNKYKESDEKECETKQYYLDSLKDDLTEEGGRLVFKKNNVVSKGKRVRNIRKVREDFVDKIIEKLNERFPPNDSQVMYAMGALGMKPIASLNKMSMSGEMEK